MKGKRLPELLCPAGSPEALCAAVEGGADAVYFGGPAFNARMRAQNFTEESMRQSISLCHAYGVKCYITLNTLVRDVELKDFLEAAAMAYRAGADALIVADLGGAEAIHGAFPDLPLHASTQASGHNTAAAREFAKLGYSRMVIAREATREDIAAVVQNGGIETEVFVHGALCVSHSGQCLFSSLVGGRSGNRGECAQPCRLPDKKGNFPLSLKDLSLAKHIPELIGMGVTSLKIEGRLKSPEYVRDVARVFRRLLDEERAAREDEMAELASVFSRGGFTDGYFTGHIDRNMMGVRSESDKRQSRALTPFTGIRKRVPAELTFSMKANLPMELTLCAGGKTVTVKGDIPFPARTSPLDAASVERNLCKFGGTPYEVVSFHATVEEGLMVPLSALNALRRAAVEKIAPASGREITAPYALRFEKPEGEKSPFRTARFENAAQITGAAKNYFALCYLPLDRYEPVAGGVVMPPVIFDRELPAVREQLAAAVKKGAKHALVGNLGHLALCREYGLVPHGDFRLNVTNGATLSLLLREGFADVLLSPELTLPQIRDIKGACDAVVYGRIPLMTLEKCAGREVGDCAACGNGKNLLTDRVGERFPILCLPPHRNVVFNSRPTGMSDRGKELAAAGIANGHFLFSVETPEEVDRVIERYQNGTPLCGAVRRI